MSKYVAPITVNDGSIIDRDGYIVMDNDIARDLTAYYELLAKQAECGKTGHNWYHHLIPAKSVSGFEHSYKICIKCGLMQT